ncbi:MAG: F0F1 ATP synthase subunit B [Planctomycetota bacterium]|nr:F0F1 ATP synthase subunit B [Planctomycetota bacterium]
MFWLCLVVSVGTVGSLTPQSKLWAAANAEVQHGSEITAAEVADGHATGGHGEHDPFDLTHANAGKDQADPAALPKSDLAIWTFVVFALLLVVLRKFAWAPIMESLHKREHFVESQLQQAKESNEQAQRLLTDHQQKLTQAQEEIRQMMELARKDAETHRQQVVAEADQAAQGHKNRALQAIEAAKNSALSELAERSVDTAVGLAGKIVRRQLNRNDHADLVKDALANFPGKN